MKPTILEHALAWHAAGYTPVPIQTNGEKRPIGTWTHLQNDQPTEAAVRLAFAKDTDGLGLICGASSGHLEMFEAEGRAVIEGVVGELATLMTSNGFGELWARLTAGYVESTPAGGIHWYYRVDGTARTNTKLASRPSTADELAAIKAAESAQAQTITDETQRAARLAIIEALTPEKRPQVLLETRGQGGFTVIAPSAGRTHPTGAAWSALTGSVHTVPVLTEAERDALHAIATMLDQMPATAIPTPRITSGSTGGDSSRLRPGDDYNERATWGEILTPRGWTRAHHFGGNAYGWTRPGKSVRDGISATTGRNDGDNLYVFSTSTELPTAKPLSKFHAYALLEHGGDFSAAAKDLASNGYGEPLEPSRDVPITTPDAPFGQIGNLATVTALPSVDRRPLTLVDERTLDRSDDGNALLLIERFGDRIRYIPERGRWIAWDGSRWQWCPAGGGTVREYAKRVARALPDDSVPALSHKKKSLSANGTTAMITQAETDGSISTQLGELDAHGSQLNTPGGVVDLRTGTIRPSDPAGLHTRSTRCTPDATVPTPMWDQFLRDTFDGHPDVQPFVQRLAGYSATGQVTHHVLPFLHGPGGNGKSVFLDVLRALLGDYAGSAPAKFLMAGQSQHETEIARLAGLRMVICSEVNQDDKFDEAKVKLLTGGDALTARFMRQDHFTFTPTHHLWLMGNHQPKVAGGGESFWRRLRMVSFTNTVPDEKKVEDLAARLIDEEGPGILAWVVAGAVDLAGGMRAPASVMAATNVYAEEEDALARFVGERCHLSGGSLDRTSTSEVRAAYTEWCRKEGEKELSPQVFGRELRTRYDIAQARANGRRYYTGLTLLLDPDEELDKPQEWYR
jgi:putative DNA primase/helicase